MLRHLLISTMLPLIIGSASIKAADFCTATESEVVNPSRLPDSAAVNNKSDNSISRNVFIEYGGPSLGIGIGYDQRFKPTSAFGFSAGLSFTCGSWDNSGWFGAYDGDSYTNVEFKGVTIPLEINAIFGKRASKFELGIGATPCILHRHEVNYWGCPPDNSKTEKDGSRINIFGTINIGYRLQRKSGFFLRAGMTVLIGDIDFSPIDGLFPIPNISLGYTIR
ncbi:MAG: hypothetical protein K2F68_07955 [Duncaniella sp.]|nr:hypothetical protein [Duncaniella sp.]